MERNEIFIVDYGMGNLLSVKRAVEQCGKSATITADPLVLASAKKIILPGVGAFSSAMKSLNNLGLDEAIKIAANSNAHILGICLGMQILLRESHEFEFASGLGLIPGQIVSIANDPNFDGQCKIPHIGWTTIQELDSKNSITWNESALDSKIFSSEFYFTHSYMAILDNFRDCVSVCKYAGVSIPAIIKRGNIVGVQFHPEKSGQIGLKLIENFISA